MESKEKDLKEKIVDTGRRLYARGLAVASSGNISARLSEETILITSAQAYLADLSFSNIVKVNLNDDSKLEPAPSSELPLHKLVYKNSPAAVVLHCHLPLANGYFAVNSSLEVLTFESRFYLGNIPVIKQETPTVTKTQEVIDALRVSNIVVLKNHGVVAVGDNFSQALALVETLEDAVKTAVTARLFRNEGKISSAGQNQEKKESSEKYPMFSTEHIKKIVELVNQDQFIAAKGKELDLTVELAIKLDGSNKVYKFNFKQGKITRLDYDGQAPFVISASADIWKDVFLGKLDPFVAVTQGKMNLSGQLGQLSRWYVPFSRLFELFKQVKFEDK